MSEKLSNHHFGRHVFEYFPWYTYPDNLLDYPDIDIIKHNDMRNVTGNLSYTWFRTNDYICTTLNNDSTARGYFGITTIGVDNNMCNYAGLKEYVTDWEDIEKIRLRYNLPTKDEADSYIKTIKIYNDLHDIISDCVFMQIERDIDIPIMTLKSISDIDIQDFITEDDVYTVLDRTHNANRFVSSVREYYLKYRKISEKQMTAIKKALDLEIRKAVYDKNIPYLYVKTDGINTNRIVSYLKDAPDVDFEIKYKIYNNFMLIYV